MTTKQIMAIWYNNHIEEIEAEVSDIFAEGMKDELIEQISDIIDTNAPTNILVQLRAVIEAADNHIANETTEAILEIRELMDEAFKPFISEDEQEEE